MGVSTGNRTRLIAKPTHLFLNLGLNIVNYIKLRVVLEYIHFGLSKVFRGQVIRTSLRDHMDGTTERWQIQLDEAFYVYIDGGVPKPWSTSD